MADLHDDSNDDDDDDDEDGNNNGLVKMNLQGKSSKQEDSRSR